MIAVGLLGLGTVGTAVVEAIRARYSPEVCEVVVAAVKRLDGPSRNVASLTSSALEVVEDERVMVIIECIGPSPDATHAVRRALDLGKPVVTSNKSLVAEHGHVFSTLAAKRNTKFLYEAAVAGAIPVVSVLRDYLVDTSVRRIRGVLNGTSGFVMDQLSRGTSLTRALRFARHHGYAEADTSRDLDGSDAVDKAVILHRLAFPRATSPSVTVTGIGDWQPSTTSRDEIWRLVAEIDANGIDVSPRPLTQDDSLGWLSGVECGVSIITEFGQLTMTGPGAGGKATAAAVLADLRPLIEKDCEEPF